MKHLIKEPFDELNNFGNDYLLSNTKLGDFIHF